MPAKVYTEQDTSLEPLSGKTLAVIGYGSQGHAHAQSLRDSGCNVIIGLYPGSKSRPVAEEDGFEVYDTGEATSKADVIMIGVPDMRQAEVFENDMLPNLAAGKTILFSHGFAVHFNLIKAPADVNVIMVAPKGPGHVFAVNMLRVKGFLLWLQSTRRFWQCQDIALAWANGIGGARAGVIETTFKEETETDLFGEQAVLCGGASALVQAVLKPC